MGGWWWGRKTRGGGKKRNMISYYCGVYVQYEREERGVGCSSFLVRRLFGVFKQNANATHCILHGSSSTTVKRPRRRRRSFRIDWSFSARREIKTP